MEKWEYKSITVSAASKRPFQLDELGKKGWELVSVCREIDWPQKSSADLKVWFYFKRRISLEDQRKQEQRKQEIEQKKMKTKAKAEKQSKAEEPAGDFIHEFKINK